MTKILLEINLINPFKMELTQLLEKISYFVLETWIVKRGIC